MHVSDFTFDLPEHLIAHYPMEERTHSRLMHLNASTGEIRHLHFYDLPDLLKPEDLMVFNNTKVIAARFHGTKATGGKIELLLERVVAINEAITQIRASKTPKPGSELLLEDGRTRVEVLGREGSFFHVRFPEPVHDVAARCGHMPLPPYIEREDEALDEERYQTVYAREEGAVAAPTAGLHFDEALLETIADRGVRSSEVTLHVGAGTFQPVRVDEVEAHEMHKEFLDLNEDTCSAVATCRENSGRVIAVGTTSVRCLESASVSGELKPFTGDTDIFIYPGYEFQTVDAMITNFHLPGSTLIMLVSAFAGIDNIKHAYETAVEESYRFFSYGDAMLITR